MGYFIFINKRTFFVHREVRAQVQRAIDARRMNAETEA